LDDGDNFLLSLLIWASFDPSDPGFQMVESSAWRAR
jgi:NADH:ubiquinone oxidoreductase subunit 4 (subunit M)